MEREAKAKVVVSVWGEEFVQFLAALDVLPWSIWEKRFIDQGKRAKAARNSTNSAPQTDVTTFAFASLSILLLCLDNKLEHFH